MIDFCVVMATDKRKAYIALALVSFFLILHEQMSMNVITGTLITLGGVYLVNREFKKQTIERR